MSEKIKNRLLTTKFIVVAQKIRIITKNQVNSAIQC